MIKSSAVQKPNVSGLRKAGKGSDSSHGATQSRQPGRRKARLVVRLALDEPRAESVQVVGTFRGARFESLPMRKARKGQWIAEIPLLPGRYEYYFLVDGMHTSDPSASRFALDASGRLNAVILL